MPPTTLERCGHHYVSLGASLLHRGPWRDSVEVPVVKRQRRQRPLRRDVFGVSGGELVLQFQQVEHVVVMRRVARHLGLPVRLDALADEA